MLKTLHLQMLLKGFRRMFGLCCGQKWKHHLLLLTLFWLLTAVPRTGLGHFLGDTKAVLKGCEDHWSLHASMPVLLQITVCVDVRVVTPRPWVAFSYSSVHMPKPELGLEGDEHALYAWLLRVRHRFPLQLSLTNWHRVCLRRDVLRNLFSLEVDGKTVSERTVVAQAIPASGSLWLGCRSWEHAPGSQQGEVELYLFRMWADLSSHGPCEDGSLVGWNARYWGLTSARAGRRDPDLQCASPVLARRAFVSGTGGNQFNFTLTPAAASTSHMTTQTGSSLVTCAFQQLCSSRDAYFWAVLRVEAVGGDMAEGDVQNLVSDIFSCRNRAGFTDFCQDDRKQLQVVQVTCGDKRAIRNTTCDLLLQLSHARPACELRRAAVWALHNSRERRIRVQIQGEVERVGRDLCMPAASPSGHFVRCTSGSSLDELCQAKKAHKLTCSVTEPDSTRVPQNHGEPCSGTPRFCDCSTFCNSTRQFFAVKIDVNRAFVDTAFLKNLLSAQNVAGMCPTGSVCQDISNHYKGVYLQCREMLQRLPGCTVMLEMSRPVNICTLDETLQQLIRRNAGIRIRQPARRMVVCGPPGLSLHTLLTSNLSWASGTQMSDICQPGNRLLRCDKNEKIGVLLTDSCRPTSQQSSIQRLTPTTNDPVAMTTWPHTTVTLKTVSSSPSKAAQPVVQTVPERTSHNTSSSLTERTATSRPASLSSLIPLIADIDSTVNTTTVAPEFVLNAVTSAAVFKSPHNHTNLNNVTTPTPFPEGTEVPNVAIDDIVSPNNITEYNTTTKSSQQEQLSGAITMTNTTANVLTMTAAHNQTRKDSLTTVTSPSNLVYFNATPTTEAYETENRFTVDGDRNHHNHTNSSPYAAEFRNTATTESASSVNTGGNDGNPVTKSMNKSSNHTTTSYNDMTQYNITDSLKEHNNLTGTFPPNYDTNDTKTTTYDGQNTAVNSVATAANSYTTVSKTYTTEFTDTTSGTATGNATKDTFTPLPDYTNMDHRTTVSAPNTNATTVSPNETVSLTASAFGERVSNTTAITQNTAAITQNTTAITQYTAAITQNTAAITQNTTAITQYTAAITQYTAQPTRSVTLSNHSYATTNTGPSVAGRSTANVSQTTTKAPAVISSTTVGNAVVGHIATDASNRRGPPSALTTTTLPLASRTVFSAVKPETPQRTTGATTKSIRAQVEQASKLLEQTRDVSQLNSSQISQLAEQLGELLDGPTVSQDVGQMALNIISNLMDGDSGALSASANRLIRAVEDLGVKLVVTGDSEVVSSNSLVLAVKKVDGTQFPPTSVDIYGTDSVQFRGVSRSRSERLGSALGSVFLPPSLGSCLARDQQQQASRVQFSFYTKPSLFLDAALSNQTLVGPVLGSSVANLSITNLTENIEFTIRNIDPAQSPQVASCVFWDFSLNGGGGGWSSAGCFLVNATAAYTTCSCDHLTSFAILLDLSRQGLPDHRQARALTFITYIGCGMSAVFLAATLLSYLLFEKLLRDIPAKILVQLCVSLLLLNLLFLLDGWLVQHPSSGLCISTAFFLHYFLLTSFTWAGLEALHMYLSVVQVFLPYLSRYMLKVSLIGWGLPLLVVIVTISVDKDNYGLVPYSKHSDGTSDKFCWLRNDVAFYVGVVAYFLLVFALCLLVFIMVMVQLARIKRQNPQNQSPNRGVLTDVRSITGLVILLGLTWGFALFSWGPLALPFTYLFSIFNSLQGFLVFVFHCAAKENVRRQWRTRLCCGRLRLVENSEWSRTATRSNRTTPVASSWAPHFPSRSSSVISDGTSNGGSVFADSGISDCCSNDVILNEIHRNLPPWREA